VVVVGAGHAGIEAALASARMGVKTACVTLDASRIGHLPCNCSIGGPAKGHLAREVDALGGQMAVTTDRALTHIRRVGTAKGPSIQTLRAHVCKKLYPELMQETLRNEPNLTLIEGSVEWIEGRGSKVEALRVVPRGETEPLRIETRAAVLTTGTFLNGLCHEGSKKSAGARHGDRAVGGLSEFLSEIGVTLKRFKTGTTPRVRLSSLKLDGLECLEPEPDAGALSFLHGRVMPARPMLGCWQTRTNAETHAILRENLHQSAMYSGEIEGVGPRYCPSVEDKVVRFSGKDSHPIFLEIEEWGGESVYVQGFSTSMPAEVQIAALKSIPGLESVEVLRPGYAVEYDMADPLQLFPTLMSKQMEGLFLAGQLNGTSGYEEAAGQGIVAGINAARYARDEEPVLFSRSESFLGVMVDDLVTKGVDDPYRMLTARAEHRLHLRHDNADQRLTPLARRLGLCGEDRWERFSRKRELIERGLRALEHGTITPANNGLLESSGHAPVTNKASLFELMRRPEFGLADAESLALRLGLSLPEPLRAADACESETETDGCEIRHQAREQIELAAKYDGYLRLQQRVVDQARRLEDLRIPASFEYESLRGLSFETIEKLSRVRPATVGQASRVPGVRPTDIALLIGHLRGVVRRRPARQAESAPEPLVEIVPGKA